jgi:hypothetical protein
MVERAKISVEFHKNETVEKIMKITPDVSKETFIKSLAETRDIYRNIAEQRLQQSAAAIVAFLDYQFESEALNVENIISAIKNSSPLEKFPHPVNICFPEIVEFGEFLRGLDSEVSAAHDLQLEKN